MKPTARIKPYLIQNRWYIASGLACLIAVDILQLLIPRVIKWAVDDLTAYRIDQAGLVTYASYIVVMAVLIGILRYIWRRCLMGTSRKVEEGLRNELFAHIQSLSSGYFDRTKTGDLMAHATNDIQQIRMATGMGMVALNDAIVLGAASIGFMAYINVFLTLCVLIPAPLIIFGTRIFSRKMHRRYQAVQAAFADLTEVVRERFAGIRIVKAYHSYPQELASVQQTSRAYIRQNLRLIRITGTFFPMMLLFSNVSLAIVLYVGGRQTILTQITPGDFVAFLSYIGLLTWPMMAMGWVTNLIQRGRASLDRIHAILETPVEIREAASAKALPQAEGRITFSGVGFAYDAQGPQVLERIDCDIRPGTTLGIVGPPGSGKTTLLNMIPRHYDATQGQITLDGHDIRELRLADLRSQIVMIPQEPFLFSGSIRDNITLGSDQIDEAQLRRACAKAALLETVQSMPNGFETVVGEKGVILSGGQKQRVGLARALLQAKPVLILDDPVSQVDAATGNAIIQTLRDMAGRQTIIIVSHRIAAVRFADQILVISDGRITASGTHATLLAEGGYYANTHRLQEIEEALDA